MASSDSITFDVKPVDTQLAKEYMKTKSEIHPKGFAENGTYENDAYNNKIFLCNVNVEPNKNEIKDLKSTNVKLLKLRTEITKNKKLFCQLEYLLRGLPVEDVEKYDIKLIINNLLYCYKEKKIFEVYNDIYCDKLAFLADTPLAVLGFVGQSVLCNLIHHRKTVTIVSNKHTAAIASLFVDLCHQVGLEEVKLLLVSENTDCSEFNLLKVSGLCGGCIGIVSNKSDIDSAVDTFLSSSNWYPWRIKKVFIQESALKRFTSAMKWKTREGESDAGACEVSYSQEDKLFVLEPGSVRASTRRIIVLEAYRTVKELLSLLENEKPFAISLWCSDLAETNEIAHNADVNIVWVNDLANFVGPSRSSQAFYSIIDLFFSSHGTIYVPELDQIKKLRTAWMKHSAEKRELLLLQEARKHVFFLDVIKDNDFQDSFVDVTETNVILGTIVPADIWLVDFTNKMVNSAVINFLMKGGGLLVKYVGADMIDFFRNVSAEVEAPVVFIEEFQNVGPVTKALWKQCYKHKVIWTNHGTMFAN